MDFGLDNKEFCELHRRVSYRLGEWNSPEWSHKGRESYRDSYITELERAHKVFTDNPELSDKLPDDRCDPIIGLTRIYNLCHQIIKDKTTQKKPTGTGHGNDKSTIAGRNGDVKKMIRPTIEKIVEIIEKLKTLQAKVVDLINKKSIVPDDKVSNIVEKLSISSKIQQKEETKDNIAGILKLTQQAEITKMQREGSWPEDIKQLMNEIEKLLFPYLDYLEEKGTSGKWEQAYIEYLIKAGIPSKLDEVTQELEKIKYKIEVELQQSAPDKPADTEQNEKLGGKIKTKDKPGRPKVSKEKAQERRKIKSDWERLRDTIKGANKKKKFCDDYEDADITVEYLNNSVLRWCRDHPK